MPLERLSIKILPDSKRVIEQFFMLSPERTKRIVDRIISLSEAETFRQIAKVKFQFGNRHKKLDEIILFNYEKVKKYIPDDLKVTPGKKMLIGAFFTKEYSIEAAALFNPSIVVHPDQTGLNKNGQRFVLSLRATGEGHLSSIEFREGVIENGEIIMTPASKFCELPRRTENKKFQKSFVKARIITEEELKVMDILESNYEIEFDSNTLLSERVIFPASRSESVGMEDVRLVKFQNDDGSFCYYGTYTAYNGKSFRVQLLETTDFRKFGIRTLHGSQMQDKGMALFPRKINGKYAITSRNDGENLYLMFSDDLYNWNEKKILYEPHNPFEFVQAGNCGSPIETKYGWLLITHAVGYFRRYSISAMLLDIDDPSKIIGSMNKALIEPDETEREGYVPNVVYSCGSMLHGGNLIIPYAMSDSSCGFARIPLEELISNMKK